MVMFTLSLCMELVREKAYLLGYSFPQSTFTNFSEELREACLPPGIKPKVGISKEE